jgi:hypothetical protein
MVKHVFIPQGGFHIGFEHAKQIDWDHARNIIGCSLIEVAQARWDGKNYVMLCDEEASFSQKKENLKASKAYHDYWFNYNKEHPEDARDELDIIRRKIAGHVILSEI